MQQAARQPTNLPERFADETRVLTAPLVSISYVTFDVWSARFLFVLLACVGMCALRADALACRRTQTGCVLVALWLPVAGCAPVAAAAARARGHESATRVRAHGAIWPHETGSSSARH